MANPVPYVDISPESRFGVQDLIDLWRSRDLMWMLVTRGIKTRYKQTVLGFLWPVIQSVVLMLVFTFIFGQLSQLPTDGGLPHAVFIYSGLIPWQFFAAGLAGATSSLVSNAALMTKVYFPRVTLLIVAISSAAFDMLLSFAVLIVLMVSYGIYPSIVHFLALPLFVLLAGLIAFSMGLWLAALNVRIRDVGLGVSFLIRIWMYLTPVAYSSQVFPAPFDKLYVLNPMVSVIEGFRWALLGTKAPSLLSFGISVTFVCVLLVSGMYYFKRVEAVFADVV